MSPHEMQHCPRPPLRSARAWTPGNGLCVLLQRLYALQRRLGGREDARTALVQRGELRVLHKYLQGRVRYLQGRVKYLQGRVK